MRYVRFGMSGCPQDDPGTYQGCAIGEVAFAEGSAVVTPEPASAALVLTGLLGFAVARRRKDDIA